MMGKATAAVGTFAPYLINRDKQEMPLSYAITEMAGAGARAFVIAGPENECPDAFLDRVGRIPARTC